MATFGTLFFSLKCYHYLFTKFVMLKTNKWQWKWKWNRTYACSVHISMILEFIFGLSDSVIRLAQSYINGQWRIYGGRSGRQPPPFQTGMGSHQPAYGRARSFVLRLSISLPLLKILDPPLSVAVLNKSVFVRSNRQPVPLEIGSRTSSMYTLFVWSARC